MFHAFVNIYVIRSIIIDFFSSGSRYKEAQPEVPGYYLFFNELFIMINIYSSICFIRVNFSEHRRTN